MIYDRNAIEVSQIFYLGLKFKEKSRKLLKMSQKGNFMFAHNTLSDWYFRFCYIKGN